MRMGGYGRGLGGLRREEPLDLGPDPTPLWASARTDAEGRVSWPVTLNDPGATWRVEVETLTNRGGLGRVYAWINDAGEVRSRP